MKKSLKVENLIDAIQHDNRVIEAILLRIEHSLTKTMERIVNKYAMKMEKSIEQKLKKLTDEHTRMVTSINKENQLLQAIIDNLETYSRLNNLVIQRLEVSLSAGPDNVSEGSEERIKRSSLQARNKLTCLVCTTWSSHLESCNIRHGKVIEINHWLFLSD